MLKSGECIGHHCIGHHFNHVPISLFDGQLYCINSYYLLIHLIEQMCGNMANTFEETLQESVWMMSSGNGRFNIGTSVIYKKIYFSFLHVPLMGRAANFYRLKFLLLWNRMCTSPYRPFYGHIFINKEFFVARGLENLLHISNKTARSAL